MLARAPTRQSSRLAAKPRINYYEAPVPSEAQIRAQEEAAFVRNALKAKRNAEKAVAREDKHKAKAVRRIIRQLERPQSAWQQEVAAVRAELGCSFGHALKVASERRRAAVRAAEAQEEAERISAWLSRPAVTSKRTIAMPAPPPAPRLERQNAVLDLPPPPPLRRTCQLSTCDEWCSYCRENDRIAAINRLPPPPTHLPVLRIPINLGAMTAQEMSDLIAALAQAMANK